MRVTLAIILVCALVSAAHCSHRRKKKDRQRHSFELSDPISVASDTEERRRNDNDNKSDKVKYGELNFKCNPDKEKFKPKDRKDRIRSRSKKRKHRKSTMPDVIFHKHEFNENCSGITHLTNLTIVTNVTNVNGNQKSNCSCACKCNNNNNYIKERHQCTTVKANIPQNPKSDSDVSRMNMGSFEIIDAEYDSVPANQVKIVFVIFAHGEVIPDPEELRKYAPKELFEDFETGLSDLGKNESYNVGSYLRTRYRNYLSDVYVQNEIRIRSLDIDYVKSSMIMALAGLYPPLPSGETMAGTPNLQPVPYDSVPLEDDDLVPYENCPTYRLMRKQASVLRKVQQKLVPVKKSLIEERYFRAGTKNDFDVYKAVDAWKVLRFLCPCNMEAEKVASFRSTAMAIREAAKYSFWTQLYNHTMIRFAAGVMMNEVVKAIDLIENNIPTVKMYLVAGGDFQVAAWMAASKVFALHQPDHGAVYGLEIYRIDKYDDYAVRALYKPKSDKQESILLKIKECREKNGYCSTREFKRAIKKYLISDTEYKKECKQQQIAKVKVQGRNEDKSDCNQ